MWTTSQAFLSLWSYLNAARFLITKDDDALKWIFNQKDATIQLAYCCNWLADLQFGVLRRTDVQNHAAEELSGREKTRTNNYPSEDRLPEVLILMVQTGSVHNGLLLGLPKEKTPCISANRKQTKFILWKWDTQVLIRHEALSEVSELMTAPKTRILTNETWTFA